MCSNGGMDIDNLLMVTVGSNWTDRTPLIGLWNPITDQCSTTETF